MGSHIERSRDARFNQGIVLNEIDKLDYNQHSQDSNKKIES